MVDVELQPRYHQSMHFGYAQCGGVLIKFCVAFDWFFNVEADVYFHISNESITFLITDDGIHMA
jgi:hypothetical protein